MPTPQVLPSLPLSAAIEQDGVTQAEASQRMQLLDDPQEWAAFSLPEKSQTGRWSSSVVFEGMHCAACAITIEDALRSVPGVASVQISAASHRGRIVWSPDQTRPSQWMRSVERFGYKAIPANDVGRRGGAWCGVCRWRRCA
jgi:P-type Cu2+ transporter